MAWNTIGKIKTMLVTLTKVHQSVTSENKKIKNIIWSIPQQIMKATVMVMNIVVKRKFCFLLVMTTWEQFAFPEIFCCLNLTIITGYRTIMTSRGRKVKARCIYDIPYAWLVVTNFCITVLIFDTKIEPGQCWARHDNGTQVRSRSIIHVRLLCTLARMGNATA